MSMNDTSNAQVKILIVDDIPENLDVLRRVLEPEGYRILFASSGETALKIAQRAQPDVILLDVIMPGMDGFATCKCLKVEPSTAGIPIIFITAKDDTKDIVEGFKIGGVDYIVKPLNAEEVRVRIQNHLKINQLTHALLQKNEELLEKNSKLEKRTEELALANEKLQQEIARRQQVEDALQTADEKLSLISERDAERWGISGFVGKSKTIGNILEDVRRIHQAGTISVLITGESGTGKELIARAIHFGGPRAKGPFIPVNCSAIPHDLAESTFFGHVRGAFTGANADRKGYFELAHKGTLFLDEIGDMPLDMQAKLLRVLEDGTFIPVGATADKRVDVRVLAATNVDLQRKIADNTFRQDLYFRIAQFTVVAPPLRDRQEDIPLLANHFLQMFAAEMRIQPPTLSSEALSRLTEYGFPGNVRELKNIIERALIESGGGQIRPEHLHFFRTEAQSSPLPSTTEPQMAMSELPLNLEQAEAILIKRAIAQADGNMAAAARLLGINRTKLYRKIAQAEFNDEDDSAQ